MRFRYFYSHVSLFVYFGAQLRILKKEDWFHEDGFPISVERRDPQEPFGIHAHEFSEIVIVVGGAGLHVTDEDSWMLSPGDVFVIGRSRPHDYQDMNNLQLINILFDPDSLALKLYDLPTLPGYHALFHLEPIWRQRHQFKSRLHLEQKELNEAVRLVDTMEGELKRREKGFQFLSTSWFMQLMGYLSLCYGKVENADSISLLSIASTISHIETHFAEPIQVEELINMSRMSRSSFLREFEAAVGCTPIAHVIRLRIERASELLKTTDLSITEIAFAVGYNDSNYFSRQFRKSTDYTPRQYRKLSKIQG